MKKWIFKKPRKNRRAAQRLLAQKNDLNKETRKNVVSVRISDDVMSIIDDLITSGHVNSRSEGASYLIMLGVKSHYSFFNELSKEVVVIEEQRKKIKYLIESALIFPEKSPNSRLIE
ncbi:hypothetical protein [Paenibacillus silvae]|uniref:hypothetical protein n=1 Tax=Paenibacillus silvae TaxID=1325358 RepID=UPI0011A36E30|nr:MULTISPECIES: hypothetical protein [Paenibacillus]MCK6075233.1 hypothetical protein [Paenibacillus silvae]MCK6149620.1 hypothetical protein [Paenibacillus silvae]MCK6267918.1 hypothetical protein [Paenibacillus silvae]